jgi:hypothetical protein
LVGRSRNSHGFGFSSQPRVSWAAPEASLCTS